MIGTEVSPGGTVMREIARNIERIEAAIRMIASASTARTTARTPVSATAIPATQDATSVLAAPNGSDRLN